MLWDPSSCGCHCGHPSACLQPPGPPPTPPPVRTCHKPPHCLHHPSGRHGHSTCTEPQTWLSLYRHGAWAHTCGQHAATHAPHLLTPYLPSFAIIYWDCRQHLPLRIPPPAAHAHPHSTAAPRLPFHRWRLPLPHLHSLPTLLLRFYRVPPRFVPRCLLPPFLRTLPRTRLTRFLLTVCRALVKGGVCPQHATPPPLSRRRF